MCDLVPLVELPRLLLRNHTGAAPTYQKLYMLIVNGGLPQAVRVRGRLFIPRTDLPAVAKTLGMTERQPAEATAA